MENKIFIIVGICIVLFGGMFIYNQNIIENGGDQMEEEKESKVYQGPVPMGYDLEHFRKTGETKPLDTE